MTAPAERPARDLSGLFDPRSIAIIGASDDPNKYGNWLAQRALSGPRPVVLVNRSRDTVLGHRAVRRLGGEQVDLAVIAVPAVGFNDAVDEALRAGARAIVAITSGLGELGGEHLVRQQAITARVRAAGAVLLGPNCFGLLDHSTRLDVCSNDLPRGSISLISQSGNVALDVAAQLDAYGLGVSRFVSVGNQADIDVAELIDSCVEHEPTTAIALYCEGFSDGRAFVAAAARAHRAGKPVVLLTVGRGAASVRGAASHTGAMITSETVIAAACDAAAAELVSSAAQMADLLQAVTRMGAPRGRRVAIVADGGGHASLASDAIEAAGLSVEPFGPETRAALGAQLPPSAGTSNPVDIAGAGERDIDCFRQLTELMLGSADVHSTVLSGYFGGYREYNEQLGSEELAVAEAIPKLVGQAAGTFVAQLMFDRSPAAQALRDGGVAVYRDIETAAWALRRVTERSLDRSTVVPTVPAAEPPITEVGYWPSRRQLMAAGIPFGPATEVATRAELIGAADRLTYPLVLKALADEHKSDQGGVVLGIETRDQLLDAWQDLQQRLAPPTCSVEQMIDLTDAVELIVGVRNDPSFGTVVLVGLGGVFTELLRDTQCALGPVTAGTARRMMTALRGSAVLAGFRGRPAVHLDHAAALISSLSAFAAGHPEIGEIECNPVAVTPETAISLDARIILG